jgi:hypothetical protein
MNQRIQQALLVIFSLLQCVSPLAHAHADGINIGHAGYIYETGDRSVTGDIYAANNNEGAIISMPQGYLYSASLSLSSPTAYIINSYNPLNMSGATSAPLETPRFAISNARFSSPWAQAPPRIATSA